MTSAKRKGICEPPIELMYRNQKVYCSTNEISQLCKSSPWFKTVWELSDLTVEGSKFSLPECKLTFEQFCDTIEFILRPASFDSWTQARNVFEGLLYFGAPMMQADMALENLMNSELKDEHLVEFLGIMN